MASTLSKSFTLPTIMEESGSTYQVNAARFAPRDLSLFIESLETIARLERQRSERRQRRKEQQLAAMQLVTKAQVHSLPESEQKKEKYGSTVSLDAVEDEPVTVMTLEAKDVPRSPVANKYTEDESYFSGPGSGPNSPRNSVRYEASSSSSPSASDSEDSGVYPLSKSGDITPIRPRSQVITKPTNNSTRSRIISLVLKRDYTQAKKPKKTSSDLDEIESIDGSSRESERCDRVLNDMIRQQFESMTSLSQKKKSRKGLACKPGSPEERFLDKALRYLTL